MGHTSSAVQRLHLAMYGTCTIYIHVFFFEKFYISLHLEKIPNIFTYFSSIILFYIRNRGPGCRTFKSLALK
jgi:hypothetical protein